MDNYFVSYKQGKGRKHTSFIVPELSVISNTSSRDDLVEHIDDNPNHTELDAFKAIETVNPYTFRISHPIALDSFVIGPTDMFYEVWEGIYCVKDGTLKLKVKKQYGK